MQPKLFFLAGLVVIATVAPDLALADDAPPLSIYGFARFDVIASDSRMSDVQRPFYVEDETTGADDAELSMHPRLSRVGLSIDEWKLSDPFTGRGLIEIDFQGEGDLGVRLRHAYAELSIGDGPDDKLDLLAGQTWDLMSPLFPSSSADTLLGNAGNTGWLRPQLRMTLSFSNHVRMAFALGQSGAVDEQDADGDGQIDGVDAAAPMFQWLLEGRVRASAGNILRVGVWGHVGREQIAGEDPLASYSVGGHMLVPIGRHFSLLGEIFFGDDLDDVRGGIGQGVSASGDEIGAWGGWLELACVISARHMLAAGSSIDQVFEDDREIGGRSSNGTLYLVHRYRPVDAFQLGLEYGRWITDHEGSGRAAANRFNLSVSAFF